MQFKQFCVQLSEEVIITSRIISILPASLTEFFIFTLIIRTTFSSANSAG